MKNINKEKYWNKRFSNNWTEFGGIEQTKFFADLALKNIPRQLIKEIKKNKYSICDAGCAEGQGAEEFKKAFPNSNVFGFDFSKIAINLAQKKISNISFFVENINKLNKKFDVIYCSNTLEHLSNPQKIINHLISQTNKHLIIQIPFQEKMLLNEHVNSFDYKNFPLKIHDFILTFCRIKDTSINSSKYWPGKQLIAIYSKEDIVDKNYYLHPTITDKDYKNLIQKESTESKNLKLIIVENDLKIKKIENQLNILELESKIKDQEINKYFLVLNKIYHSKTWKILGLYKKTIKTIKNILKKILPIALRKKIKSIIEAKLTSGQVNNFISENILKEWQDWNYTSRKENSLDIINFSIIAWDFRFQRPQQLAKILGETDNRVFYIKNEFMPFNKANSIFAPIKVEKKDKNVYEVTLSATRNLFIYNDLPSKKDIKIIIASIKNLINQAQIANPISKIDHPFWSNILDQLSMPNIYDCMDNHQGFSENGNHLAKLEKKLFQDSNITLVTSKYLQKIASKNHAKNTTLIQNAGDYEHFSNITKRSKIPYDIKNIPHPIIGYYGALAEWFDTDILESMAKNNPDKSIVLIGDVTNNLINKISNKYKNIYLLGEKPYSEIPNYLNQFDVCTIPFVLNDLIKATHPVKVFEYLAAGKPVVATKMPEILDMEEIYFADKNNFSSQIKTALKNNQKNIKKRQKIAKENTWTIRTKKLISNINKILFPKVSIILLSYNHPDMAKNTIDSILTRSFYPNYELIIVDNNSDNKTTNILKSYQNIPQVKLIFNKENYGFAKGNNIGLKKATGEYFILINNDVLVTPGWISRLLFHIQKPKISLVGPVTNNIGNEAKIDIFYNPFEIKDLEDQAYLYTSSHWGKTSSLNNIAAFCWMMPKFIYQKFGGLDERFGRGMFEDDDYCFNIKKHNYKILCADDVFIHHFGGASFKQIQSAEYQKLFNDNKKKFEDKWHIKWQPHHYRK